MNYEPWIETYSGHRFNLLNPESESIDILDIAHALSMQCRFTGHCLTFYSVAEHSVIVSYLVPEELGLDALLHDAAEAYLSDIAGPLKPHISGFKELENNVMSVIAKKFNFIYPLSNKVKEADLIQLRTEAKYLLQTGGVSWIDNLPEGLGRVPACLDPYTAKAVFLDRFNQLTGQETQFSLQF